MNTLIFDTETTGLKPGDDEVLSLAICDLDGNPILKEYYRPERKTEWPIAQAVNKISPEQVADEPTLASQARRIQHLLDGADRLIAYNAPFDVAFLNAAGIHPDPERTEDAMREFARRVGREWNARHNDWRWYKLAEAAAMCGLESFGAHDPMEDVKATAWVVRFMDDPANTRENGILAIDETKVPAPRG